MSLALQFAISAVAVFRLSWLINHDYLTHSVRDFLIRSAYRFAMRQRGLSWVDYYEAHKDEISQPDAWTQIVINDPAPPKLAYIWTCAWCISIWISAAVAVMWHPAGLSVPGIVLWAAALSGWTGIMTTLLPE